MEGHKDYGTVFIGFGTSLQHELKIIDYIQGEFKDHRLVSIACLDDNTILLGIENPESTGRSNYKMRLSQESFLAMFFAMALYSDCKGIDLSEASKQTVEREQIYYCFSDNLKPSKWDAEDRNDHTGT